MKKFLRYAVVLAVLALPVISLAAEFRAGNQPSIGSSEKVLNDAYIVGGAVTSAGAVSGDLLAVGGNIVISGDVGADVMAGGGNVTILSDVADDLRVAGGTVIIQGRVGGDAVVGGGQVSIGGAGVAGDVMIGGGDVRIDAPVSGKLTVRSGSVFINAPISRDIDIEASVVKLGSGAVISGNMFYKANKELVKDPGAVINGKITFEQREKRDGRAAVSAIISVFLLLKFFALLASALVVGLALRRYSKEVVNMAIARPWPQIGKGLVAMVAMLVVPMLLVATVIGIPFGLLGMLGFAALMLFSWIVAPIIVGSVVYRYFSKKEMEVSWKTILLGVFLFTLLGLIPFIGWLIKCLLMLLALGCVASLKLRVLQEWR